ncbi:TPM domain-containing protein [Sphingopyxis sp. PET50]|uniref:TPM domain-containing protein n=1 Tax=Sphingopyxis sp. PET50 TaxID=2976533 RepID=UPI0021B089A0|nr:TPM domain-containing protein [Sphingopyxis sp. PET50]
MRRTALALPLAILLVAGGCKEVPAPEAAYCVGVPQIALQGRVTDAAAILNDEEEARLAQRLARYEARTSHQTVVATVATLNGATVEDFSTCLGNRWGIGRKDHDDGILILVAPNERRVRIATGTGMEKLLPDERAKAVIDAMTPRFQAGDYAGGLTVGIDAIAAQTGEPQ